MVGFANITAREMLDHLFINYGNIIAVDLENNFEQMSKAWDPQQPVGILFKKIQDYADFSEAGGLIIGHLYRINVGYAKIFVVNYSHSRTPPCAPARTHGQIQAPREPPN
jgi:hypothetical protein